MEIENIEQMRMEAGIDDVELRREIRCLRVGDFVKLTLLTAAKSFGCDSFVVRITRIRGVDFRGKVADRLGCPRRAPVRLGMSLTFTAAQIHSVC